MFMQANTVNAVFVKHTSTVNDSVDQERVKSLEKQHCLTFITKKFMQNRHYDRTSTYRPQTTVYQLYRETRLLHH